MRIIGGENKGKKIFYLKNKKTRPLRDFVKENIFNIIDHSKILNFKISGSNVLDLYSGIGSFGLECLSRNAMGVTFVENNTMALDYLKKNIKLLSYENKTQIINLDIDSFPKISNINKKFNLIFLDPPYLSTNFFNILKNLKSSKLVHRKNLVVIHRENLSNHEEFSGINTKIVKKYGRSKIVFANIN